MRRALTTAGPALAPALLLLPVAAGAAVMSAAGAPPSRWAVHLASAAVALWLFVAARAASIAAPARRFALCVVAAALIASTLLETGLDGVARWHQLGPLRLHLSSLFAPALLVASVALRDRWFLPTALLLASVQVVHVLQPDAGQATAFGLAAALVLARPSTSASPLARSVVALALAASVAAAWTRPDPLGPAPFVEDLFARAFRLGPAVGVAACASLVPAVAAPRFTPEKPAGAALSLYLALTVLVSLVGEFPVPLLGFGASPVLGAFLALGLLVRSAAPAPAPVPRATE